MKTLMGWLAWRTLQACLSYYIKVREYQWAQEGWVYRGPWDPPSAWVDFPDALAAAERALRER